MINRTPPELFAQQPIRSDFTRKRAAKPRRARLMATGLLVAVLGGLGAYWHFSTTGDELPAEIPVIKAEGAAKQRPEQPGGIDIPHQNETVFQQLDNTDPNKQASVEHLLPAPQEPQPVENTMTPGVPPPPAPMATPMADNPMPSAPAATQVAAVPPTDMAPAPVSAPTETVSKESEALLAMKPEAEPTPPNKDTPQGLPAKAEELHKVVEKLTPPAADTAKEVKPIQTASATDTSMGKAVLSETPKAKEKAGATKTASVSALPKSSVTAKKGGGFMVQLGSFPDQSAASTAMQKTQKTYASELSGTKLQLSRADLGAKGIYYRMQGGPMSDDAARSICAKVHNKGAACIVVKAK